MKATARGVIPVWVVLGLLAIAAIIGFAIFIPPYADYTAAAKASEVVLSLSSYRQNIQDFHDARKRLPASAAEAGFSPQTESKYVRPVTYDAPSGELRAIVQGIPNNEGKLLVLRAEIASGNLTWRCFSPDMAAKDLPSTCRTP